MTRYQNRPAITLNSVWVAAAVTLILIGPLITPVPPNDLWFHIATGQRIIGEGTIPTTDAFSYTRAGEPFYNQAWLAQVLLFVLYQAGGVPLLLLIHALTLLLAYGLLLRLAVRRGQNLRIGVALFLVTLPVSFASWNIRPQTFAFPLFVGFLYVLTAYRLGWFNRLWLLPLLMLLWVNVHGTFLLGLGLVGATFVGMLFERKGTSGQGMGERRRGGEGETSLLPLIIWGVLTALAVLVNPTGIGVLGYVGSLTGNNAVTQLVSEWAPPTIRSGSGMAFFGFLIASALVLVYARRKPDPSDWLMSLPLLWLALGAERNIVWFALVAVPTLIMAVCSLLPPQRQAAPGVPLMNSVLIGLLALIVVVCLPWIKPLWLPGPQGQLLKNTPVAAVAWLQARQDRPRRLFHTEAHGSYLTFAAPEQKVFIDPRIELYPFEQWVDYLALNGGSDVQKLIGKYNFDGMMLSKEYQAPLIEQMWQVAGWSQQYEDDLVVYFRRG